MKKQIRFIWATAFCLVLAGVSAAMAGNLKIAFFNPSTTDDVWWNNAGRIMQAACDDFGHDLTIYHADRNRAKMLDQLREALGGDNKPDAVVFQSLKKNGPEMLAIAEKAQVCAFIFNAGLIGEDIKTYGGPREKYKYWIGQMLPDDEKAGYDLAQYLFSEARKSTRKNEDLSVLGLDGTPNDFAAIERNRGLKRAADETEHIALHKTIPADWSLEIARTIIRRAAGRYPDLRVIWAANDPMALGAIQGLEAMDKAPGKDILVGSIDWIPEALSAIQNGKLTASVGGHFMEAAWVIVLIHDYFNGRDFKDLKVNFKSTMGLLNQANVSQYLSNFGDGDWGRIDFTRFSRSLNPQQADYDFTFDAILGQLQ